MRCRPAIRRSRCVALQPGDVRHAGLVNASTGHRPTLDSVAGALLPSRPGATRLMPICPAKPATRLGRAPWSPLRIAIRAAPKAHRSFRFRFRFRPARCRTSRPAARTVGHLGANAPIAERASPLPRQARKQRTPTPIPGSPARAGATGDRARTRRASAPARYGAPFSASNCLRICASTAAIAVMFITRREVALVVRMCTGLEMPIRIGPIATPSVNTRTRL